MYAGLSSSYLPSIANGGRYTIRCDAYRGGLLVPGGGDLALADGSITDQAAPGVRRQLDLSVTPEPGLTVQSLFDVLAPTGTELRVRSVFHYPNRVSSETVPMGVFDVDSQRMGYGSAGTLQLQASDKFVRIQRARFPAPLASTPGITIKAQIAALIRGALGVDETVVITASSNALMGSVVWERDRDKAILDLAKSIGAWVYFDRDGVATIADIPTAEDPVWEVSDGRDGVLLDAERSRDRSKTYNKVVVTPEKVDGTPLFDSVVVADTNPSSPTYVGGSFLEVPTFYSSPLLQNETQALKAGLAILNRVKGLNAQLTMTIARNHALDSLDTLRVRLPRVRWDVPQAVELHMADKIVHPLTAERATSIDTRSTRTDDETA
jgi:hypothetical protein